MEEQVTDHHTPAKEGNNSQQQSPNMDHVPESDKNKLKDAGDARNEKQKHAEEPKNDNAEDKNQPDVPKDPVQTEKQIGKERREDNQENESNVVKDTSNACNTDTNTEAENNNGEEEEQAVVKSDESGPDIQENETSLQAETAQILDNVETVGLTTQETVEPPVPVDTRSPGAKEANNSQQQSPNMDHVPESDKNKLKDAGDARNEKQKHAEEPKNDNAEDKNQPDVPKDPVQTEQQIGKERREDNQENESNVVKDTSNACNTDTNTEAENNNGEEEEQAVVKSDESGPDIQENETSSQAETAQILDNVETVGPTTQETVEPPVPVDTRSPGAKEVNNSQQQSPNMDHVPESDKNKLKDAGDARNEKQKHAEEPKNDNAEDKNQPDVPMQTEQQIGKERREDNQENESNVVKDTSNACNTDTNTEAENNNGEEEEQAVVKSDGSGPDIQENKTSSQAETPQILDTVGPTTQETVEPPVPVDTRSPGGIIGYLSVVMVIAAILGAVAINHFYQPESPPQTENWRPTVQFLKEMDKLKIKFPNQRAELWNRSRIHLLRHLQTAHPTEPVSLILTAGARAEKTLHCLARGFASAFSSALNASVLDIDGVSKASQDSDEVKLDIDSKLQGAFEGNTPVAIIHRFEELPPGSTLIFYRYCDHENAAYKKTFLIFTVLLGEEKEIPAESRLSAVEEMVDDHLQNKFLSHDHPVSFDRMDLDKYGGLWSRISHLILPVTAEERIGHKGCEYNRT